MNLYQADLHIHSVLSPCADLEMSPGNIVSKAKEMGLSIIAVTDHNSTLHSPLTRHLAEDAGMLAICGAEVTTREEVHCICLFADEEGRASFQKFLEEHIQKVPNKPDILGYQVVVNEKEEIVDEVEYSLHGALNVGINELEGVVHSLRGIFIPAHVDRPKFSLTSQLGFIPPDLNYDALEVSINSSIESICALNPSVTRKRFIRSSDAHFIDQVGSVSTKFRMENLSFDDLLKAIMGIDGFDIILP
jgi:PHP family Zn ribbon phosphoesterase